MSAESPPAAPPVVRTAGGAALSLLALSAALLTVVVPLTFPAGKGPTGVDGWLAERLPDFADAYEMLAFPGTAWAVLPLLAAAALWFARRRLWWRAGFVLFAPEFAVVVNTWVLKPLWDRSLHDYLAYPSGHTVHLVAAVTAVALAAEHRGFRVAAVGVGALVLAGVTVGMVGLGYHYVTDVVGGAAAAVALVAVLYIPVRRIAVRADPGTSRAPGGPAVQL
ncbi:phosphatase PAP2 family protein [Nocardia otitidiscaviarum]|uniref:phosphatase PAP2 family protein n=1 Tax=Nocardia otitidiscaviarum TaxID=1823 RepID=UPI0007C7EBB3|nr:phosphatase PAP2 family protein [Nocardia otitidiscaviarum]